MVALVQLVVLIIFSAPGLLVVLLCLALLLWVFGKRGQENREEAESVKGDGERTIENKEH